MTGVIDTHAHIFLGEFDNDRHAMVARAKEAGVERIYMPNVDADTIAPMLTVADQYPGYCIPMIGIHPTSIDRNYRQSLAKVESELSKRPYAAIGEIGLDLYWDSTYLAEQEEAFKIQVRWAHQLGMAVSIHVRNAFPETLRCLDELNLPDVRGVFHCFSGTDEDVAVILRYPYLYFGVNGTITYKKSHLPALIASIPAERIVVETDAPYLSPTPHRGKRNEPAYLEFIVHFLAQSNGVDIEKLRQQLNINSSNLFKQVKKEA